MPWRCGGCAGHNPDGARFCGHCGSPRAETAPAGTPTDERRIVTALFADISGFTTLSEKLDAEGVHEIIGPLIARLAETAEEYGGTVVKFAGDALLVFFGAPVAYEDHAVRALLVAQEMHAELARRAGDLPKELPELKLHIGVNTGEVISATYGGRIGADYSITGDAVNTAQRLEAAAPPGSTYVGELAERLTRHRFELESIGELSVKGKAKPVRAWRVVGERRASSLSSRPRVFGSTGFLVGRERELARARDALESVREGRGALLAIIGEVGAGKSSLLQAVRDQVTGSDVSWLEARCISYGAAQAYWPYATLLRRAFNIAIDLPPERAITAISESLSALGLGDRTAVFAPLLGAPDDVSAADPIAYRRQLHKAFADWLIAASERAALVVAIEDLHWADEPSVTLTSELVHLGAHHRIGFVLTSRPEGSAVIEQITEPFGTTTRIDVQPLGSNAIRELVGHALDGDPPAGLVDAIVERTAGNPLFAEEILRSLIDDGHLARTEARWRLGPGWDAEAVPPTVEGVLSARIDVLPQRAARVLLAASVVGRQIMEPLLREIVSDERDLPSVLSGLHVAGFLDRHATDEADMYSFHHALVQEVAYGRLLRRDRQRLHLRVADEAEKLYGSGDDVIDLLARNLYLGGAGARALPYLVRAGERARRLFANEAALADLTRALEIARHTPELAGRIPEITLAIADLSELTGEYERALESYRAVRDATSDVRAWRGIASALGKSGEYSQALDVLEEAAKEHGWTAELLLERAWAQAVVGRFTECVETAKHGLGVSSARNTTRASLLVQLARAEEAVGSFADARAHAKEAFDISKELDDQRGCALALRLMGAICIYSGDLDEASSSLRRGLETAQRIGDSEQVGGCLINLGLLEEKRGNFEEAARNARAALDEFVRIGHVAGRATALSNLATALVQAGEDEDAASYAESALQLGEKIRHALLIADSLDTLAGIDQRAGRHGQAAERAERAADLWMEAGEAERIGGSLQLAEEAWSKLGDTERAGRTRRRAAEIAARLDV